MSFSFFVLRSLIRREHIHILRLFPTVLQHLSGGFNFINKEDSYHDCTRDAHSFTPCTGSVLVQSPVCFNSSMPAGISPNAAVAFLSIMKMRGAKWRSTFKVRTLNGKSHLRGRQWVGSKLSRSEFIGEKKSEIFGNTLINDGCKGKKYASLSPVMYAFAFRC